MIIDPYLYVLLKAIVFIFVIIVLFLLTIITMRYVRKVNNEQYNVLSQSWETVFLSYLNGELSLTKTLKLLRIKNKYYWFWLFIEPYLESLSGDDFKIVKALCRKSGLIAHYQKQIKKGRTNKKADAARILGILKCHESINDMLKLLFSKKTFLVLAAAQGLAASGKHNTFETVARVMLANTYFTYEGATAILAGYGNNICNRIIAILGSFIDKSCHHSLADSCQLDEQHHEPDISDSVYNSILVDLLGHFRCSKSLPVLDQLLPKADYETIVHILKAYTRIGEVSDNFSVAPYLGHKYWVIRSFSAQVWPLTDDLASINIIADLLDDHHWWVRFHAAKALFSMGDKGKALLQNKTVKGKEAAADISRYILSLEGTAG